MAVMAKIAADSAARRDALAAGEAMLAAGALSHNHFHFRRIAIDLGLEQGDWALALHHGAALEAYCIAEPLRYVDLLVARARTIVAISENPGNVDTRAKLAELKQLARAPAGKCRGPMFGLKSGRGERVPL
jgi:hypothetical protein